MVLIILLYAICSLTFIFSKWGLTYSSPFFFTAIRMLIAGLLLNIYSYYKGYFKDFCTKDFNNIFKLSIFHIYLTYITDAWALKRISSTESSYIYNLSPFITAILSYIILKRRINRYQFLGILISFLALTIGSIKNCSTDIFYINLKGKIVTILSVIFSCYGWILLKQLSQKYNIIMLNGMSMIISGILSLLTSMIFESNSIKDYQIFIESIILIIISSNIIFYNLYGYLLKRYSPTLLSFFGFLCPIFTSLFAEIFLNEYTCIRLKISFIFIIIGLYIFYYEEIIKEKPAY